MLLAGDEVLRSQKGNNNAYCQNNEISWFDWSLVEKNIDMLRFTREIIAFRKRHPCLTSNAYFSGDKSTSAHGIADISWYGKDLKDPHWGDPESQVLACTIARVSAEEQDIHVIFNMSETAIEARIPTLSGKTWELTLDTSQPSPSDIKPFPTSILVNDGYKVEKRSIVVLESVNNNPG